MPAYPVVPHRPGIQMSPARRPYLRRDLLRECAACGERRELVALDRCERCWEATANNEPAGATNAGQ